MSEKDWRKFEGAVWTLEPGSPAWIRAKCAFLETALTNQRSGIERIQLVLDEMREQRAWEIYPPSKPWGTVDAMLTAIVGFTLADLANTVRGAA